MATPLESELSRVRECLQQGDLPHAASLIDAYLSAAPGNADAWYLRGVIANRRRDHAAAIVAFRKALAIRSDDALTWLGLGNAYSRDERAAEAADAYGEVLQREPDWADAHFNLGLVQRRQGNRLAATHSLHAAWVRDPMFFDAAKQCVALIADCVRSGEAPASDTALAEADATQSFAIVVCSIDPARQARVVSLYHRLFASSPHEVIEICNPRSLAEAYNEAVAGSLADIVILSHDDVDVLAPDFAARLSRQLRAFDAVGVVGSTRLDGPAVGWTDIRICAAGSRTARRTLPPGRSTSSIRARSPATSSCWMAYFSPRAARHSTPFHSTRGRSTASTCTISTGAIVPRVPDSGLAFAVSSCSCTHPAADTKAPGNDTPTAFVPSIVPEAPPRGHRRSSEQRWNRRTKYVDSSECLQRSAGTAP